MDFGFAISHDYHVSEDKAWIIMSLDNKLKDFFKNKEYGSSIESFVVGINMGICEVGNNPFCEENTPLYTEHKIYKDRAFKTNTEILLHKIYEYSISIINDEARAFIDGTNNKSRIILAEQLWKSMSYLDKLPENITDFDAKRFRADLRKQLDEWITTDEEPNMKPNPHPKTMDFGLDYEAMLKEAKECVEADKTYYRIFPSPITSGLDLALRITFQFSDLSTEKSKMTSVLPKLLKEFFKDKNYGSSLKFINIQLSIGVVNPDTERLFKQKPPKYSDRKVVRFGRRQAGVILDQIYENLYEYKTFIINEEAIAFRDGSDQRSRHILSDAFMRSIGHLDKFSRKLKDFDINRFKADLRQRLDEWIATGK